ncbi:phospholipase [bacterium]|nr:phospholipase [bacterium]
MLTKKLTFALGIAGLVLVEACRALADDSDRKTNPEHKLTFAGIERTYVLHSPQRDRTKPAPLVIALHGGSGTGHGMPKLTKHGLDDLADRDGWVIVYPDGVSKNWNDGRKSEHNEPAKKGINDVAFISALVDELVTKENLDRKRVYATGISNGGFMSQRLARDLSGKIAAIAPIAANLHMQEDVASVPSRAVSVLAINGDKDPLVPWEGGEVHFLGTKRGNCRSVRETIDWWVNVDGCSKEPVVTEEADRDPNDGTRVRREVHGGGRDGTEVVLLAIEGGGHTWPGGHQYAPEMLVGKTCRDIDANEVMWEFFKKHPMP